MRSSNCPERPTNGRPCLSSSAPGASPTNISREPGVPSANTRRLAEPFRLQPSKRSRMARSSSRLAALRAASRAAMTAASGAGGAAAPPALRRGRCDRGASGRTAGTPARFSSRRLIGGRRRLGRGQQIVRLLADDRVHAGLGVEGEQLAGGLAAVGGHVWHILCRTHGRLSWLSSGQPAAGQVIAERSDMPRGRTPWPTTARPRIRWSSTSSSSAPARPGSPPRSGSSSCRPNSAWSWSRRAPRSAPISCPAR